MADQPVVPASAPLSAEQMDAENKLLNPVPAPPGDPPPPTVEADDEDMAKDDPRSDLYARLDAENQKMREVQPPLFTDLEDEPAAVPPGTPPAPPKPAAPATPSVVEPVPGEVVPDGETPAAPVILTRAEFLETFKDFRIKDKIAGEVVEAPVDDWVRATGLEKHYTKRLMDLSRKESELLKKTKAVATPPTPSDKEIQEKYDELFMESPFKAQQYLREQEAAKKPPAAPEVDDTLRAREAYEQFVSAYPDLSQEEWARMNTPTFWQQYPDVVAAREGKEWFPTFVLAYSHLQREKLEVEKHVVRQAQASRTPENTAEIIARKKAGSVVRTTVAPTREAAVPPKKMSVTDERRAYIQELSRKALDRMNIR
jgi:hypothetical protein